MAGHSLPPLDLDNLALNLSAGFEALLQEVKDLTQREATLRKNLEVARRDHSQISPAGSSVESLNPLHTTRESNAEAKGDGLHPDQTDVFVASEAIRKAIDACRTIKMRPVKKADTNALIVPVARKTTSHEYLEHDFTTPGIQGNLECPFARMAGTGMQPAPTNGMADPIAAEFHPDQASIPSNPPSAQGPGKCPIRFLDQHSPEEVAKYFENHKHEIPRSHEICVKRYQQNEQSIRQLDAKYGNLVNMIQGLGVKHKQYLPGDGQNEPRRTAQSSVEAVEKWADGTSHKNLEPVHEQIPQENSISRDEDERKPHFERELREVRVGESPSRPWGISVPATQKPSKSAMLSDRGTEPVDLARSEITIPKSVHDEPARKCPVDHGMDNAIPHNFGGQKVRAASATNAPREESLSQPHVVFNGPVFFGYSAEQAAAVLQSANLGKRHH